MKGETSEGDVHNQVQGLSRNQKQKRRQKLSKLGRQERGKLCKSTSACEFDISSVKGARKRQKLDCDHSSCSMATSESHISTATRALASCTSDPVREAEESPTTAPEHLDLAASQQDGFGTVPAHGASTSVSSIIVKPLELQRSSGNFCDFSVAARCISLALHHQAEGQPPISSSQQAQKNSRRQYRHGNYHTYYGYRLGKGFEQDPRLQVLKKQFFQNKRCIDVGCNAGLVSLGVASQFGCASMLGIDIDLHLVQQACRALTEERSKAKELLRQLSQVGSSAEPAAACTGGAGTSLTARRKAARAAVRALAHVWFQQEDFVSAQHDAQIADTVLCLSVTKWVHLNGGDAAIRQFFARVHDVLAPGGHFILEAQPWRSYKLAVRKTNEVAQDLVPLKSLSLYPDGFAEYLAANLGFTLISEIHVPDSTAGFDRPIWIFQKGWT